MPAKFQLDAQNRMVRTQNFAGGRGTITVTYNAKNAEEPVEVMLCEEIGKDAWTGEGFNLKDLRDALNGVPTTRDLNFLTNSPGGSVSEGISIRNWLKNWKGEVTNTIIGIAASTASWCIPASNTKAYKNSQMFMHRAMGFVFGNVDEMQRAIDYLTKTDSQIADMYAEQTGGDAQEMLDLMTQETLLTGEEALNLGLVNELVDGDAKNQFSADWLNSAKQKLAALNSLRALPPQGERPNQKNQPQENNVKRTDKIALLNSWGINLKDDATLTDARLDELVNLGKTAAMQSWNKHGHAMHVTETPAPTNTNGNGLSSEDKQLLENLKTENANRRVKDIRDVMTKAAADGKFGVNEIEDYVNLALEVKDGPNGNPVVNRVNKMEGRAPGVPPIPENIHKLDVVNAEFKDIRKGFEAHNEVTESWRRGNKISMQEIANSAKAKAQFFKKFKNRFLEMVNANVIDAGLQRQVILRDTVIRDFKRRVMPLDMFSTVFRNIPLEGTDKMDVPYYDLDATASAPYAGSYDNLVSATATGKREITVGWGAAHDGDLGVGHARLVQALSFNSHEIATQPYLKTAQLAALKAEKLAYDIFRDVLSVVKVANYPALLDGGNFISCPASLFSSDNLADLKVLCKAWPEMGRGLLLDSDYDGNLMKDPTFKSAYQQALDSVKTRGNLPPELYGFSYSENPNIPLNAINLKGIAFWKFAILVAFAPVPPLEEVRRAGTTWELITDEDSAVSLEYRTYGSNSADSATHVIESNYGWAPGLKTAIKAIVTP